MTKTINFRIKILDLEMWRNVEQNIETLSLENGLLLKYTSMKKDSTDIHLTP